MKTETAILSFSKQQSLLVGKFHVTHLNDYQQADMLRKQLSGAMKEKFECMLLDCTGLLYVISEIFGVLMQLNSGLKSGERRLALCNVEPEVLELMRLNKLDKALQIYLTQEEAVREESRTVKA